MFGIRVTLSCVSVYVRMHAFVKHILIIFMSVHYNSVKYYGYIYIYIVYLFVSYIYIYIYHIYIYIQYTRVCHKHKCSHEFIDYSSKRLYQMSYICVSNTQTSSPIRSFCGMFKRPFCIESTSNVRLYRLLAPSDYTDY